MLDGAVWQDIFLQVLDLDDECIDSEEVAAEVLGVAAGDRAAIEAARVHLLGMLCDRPDDHRAEVGLSCLDAALRRGDLVSLWKPRSRSFDPWVAAQHRLRSA